LNPLGVLLLKLVRLPKMPIRYYPSGNKAFDPRYQSVEGRDTARRAFSQTIHQCGVAV
jgi:hypothetical protein